MSYVLVFGGARSVTLQVGTQLGPYEILALLGAGGMGEVYRAKDTRLGREVAIKILPEAFAGDAERVARFQREAKVLASLNHPNIAAVYGFEESDAKQFLVLELVEGETLTERLGGGALPVAEALEAAGIGYEAREKAGECTLVVAAPDAARARAELDAYARENRDWPTGAATLPQRAGGWGGVLGYAAVLLLVAILEQRHMFAFDWFAAGKTHAGLIRHGHRRQLKGALGMEVYEPHLAVIIGRSSEFRDDLDRQQLAANYSDIEVVTYDDIVDFAKQRRVLL